MRWLARGRAIWRSCSRGARVAAGAGLLLVLAAILAGVFLAGRQSAFDELRTRGVWRVAMDPSFPPFQNLDAASGQVVGLDVDLARAIGDAWAIRTEIVSLGFDELLDAVAAHQVDAAISALPMQPERTEEVRFSEPYVQAGVVLAARRGSAVQGAADLAGLRVAVEWGSQGDAEARRLLDTPAGAFDIVPYETVTAALDALDSGEVDAAIVDAISLALHPSPAGLTAVGQPLISDPYVVVVPADAPDLLQEVNRALRLLETDGTLEAIRERWLRPPAGS